LLQPARGIAVKAIIYARFSSDQQRETSIVDQERVCRGRADQLGCEVIEVVADSAVSGSVKVSQRNGGSHLLALARAGVINLIILEGLDRLSRDLVEQETVVRRLEHWGIRLVGVADGYDTLSGQVRKLARGVRGLINETYLEDLRHKVHRGLVGQIKRGYSPGLKCYGYSSVVAETNARGEPLGYRLVVNEEQAQIVRRIFRDFVDGKSCTTIAHELNAEGVPSPSRKGWHMMTIYGNRKFNHGMLRRTLYAGVLTWNRSSMRRDPDTGREKRIERPVEEWVTEQRPDLQIVDTETFQRAQVRLQDSRVGVLRATRKPNILSGLLVCGHCGSNLVATNPKSFGCSKRITQGKTACPGIWVHAEHARDVLLDYVREMLLTCDLLPDIEAETLRYLQRENRQAVASKKVLEERRQDLAAEIKRYVDAIGAVGVSTALTEKVKQAETALATLNLTSPKNPRSADPKLVGEVVRASLDRLEALMTDNGEEAREGLRAILGPVSVRAGEGMNRLLEFAPTLTGFTRGETVSILVRRNNRPPFTRPREHEAEDRRANASDPDELRKSHPNSHPVRVTPSAGIDKRADRPITTMGCAYGS
jgi:DNA invertase Pin-like site-specific DNA recombinase